MPERSTARLSKFNDLLSSPNPNLDELRELSWNGIPREVRPVAWQLLSGYLPPNVERREVAYLCVRACVRVTPVRFPLKSSYHIRLAFIE